MVEVIMIRGLVRRRRNVLVKIDQRRAGEIKRARGMRGDQAFIEAKRRPTGGEEEHRGRFFAQLRRDLLKRRVRHLHRGPTHR